MYVYVYVDVTVYVHVYMYVYVCTMHPANPDRNEARARCVGPKGKEKNAIFCPRHKKENSKNRLEIEKTAKNFFWSYRRKRKKKCGKIVLYHLGHTSVKKTTLSQTTKYNLFSVVFGCACGIGPRGGGKPTRKKPFWTLKIPPPKNVGAG